jgi:hypothetical protein
MELAITLITFVPAAVSAFCALYVGVSAEVITLAISLSISVGLAMVRA